MKRIFGEDYVNLVNVIQELLNENRLKILQGPNGYVYQLVSIDQADKKAQLNDLGDAEMLVYQCIERTGDQGIWIREIKVRTGLHAQAINRIIKKLVQRKLIKSFKSIASKMKIMYILYDMGRLSDAFVIVELPKDITGGPWYSEQEFDVGFVDAVSQFVGKVLAEEVGDWVVSQVASRTGH
ncbi:hypothetical protein WA538_004875 [Blastocystis sp. DL]